MSYCGGRPFKVTPKKMPKNEKVKQRGYSPRIAELAFLIA